jgi:hypothetical protein
MRDEQVLIRFSPPLEIRQPSLFGGAQPGLFGEFVMGGVTRSARPARIVARVDNRPSGEHSAISRASLKAAPRLAQAELDVR